MRPFPGARAMSPSRRWYRIAAGFLLVAAGGHLAAHWRFYLATDAFDAPRRAAMASM